jgi:hypothetical protein
MSVEYLRFTSFRGAYFLFCGQKSDFPQSIMQMAVGVCPACQRPYVVIQPIEYVESLLDALHEDLDSLGKLIGHPNEELSIYVCDQQTVYCGSCAGEIHLPAPELLDADRTSFGRYALWMTTNHRKIR